MFKFRIKEDTVTDYLNKLESNFEDKEKTILEEMMFAATGHQGNTTAPIPKRLMWEGPKGKKKYEYNPWLFESGQDKSFWTIETGNNGFDSVIANYSGMRGYLDNDEFMVWEEFSEEYEDDPYIAHKTSPYERTLARDYAYFQETGKDKYASPKDAHIGFVSEGLKEASGKVIPDTLTRYFKQLIELR